MSVSSISVSNKKKLKIVFLGDQNVGKTCIINRFVNDKFDEAETPTIGIDFLVTNITHLKRAYRLQLWDTAGQERYKSLIPSYLKDSNCAVVVYDVGHKQSFDNAFHWLELYHQHKDDYAFTVLVGNKIDKKQRFDSNGEIEKKCLEQHVDHYYISAKTAENLREVFEKIIQKSNQVEITNILPQDVNGSVQSSKINVEQTLNVFCSPRSQLRRSKPNIKLVQEKQQEIQKRRMCC